MARHRMCSSLNYSLNEYTVPIHILCGDPCHEKTCFMFTLCMLGYFSCFVVDSCILFSKLTFSKNSFNKTTRVSNGLDPNQDQHSVGPDHGPNHLQRL